MHLAAGAGYRGVTVRAGWERQQQIALTAARYDADAHSTDTTKVMVWTTFGF